MSTVIKAKVSKVLDRAEDPGETLDYSYQKQLESLQKVKQGIAEVVTAKKRLQMQSEKLEQSVVKLDTQARQALAQGNEELAREALERKNIAQTELQSFDSQIAELEGQQQKLTGPEAKLRALRGRRIAFITQNPMTALDPVQKIGAQVDVVSRLHLRLSAKAARARTVDLLTQLRIPEAATICDAYPHQLSGGMKQRIVIAMALAGEPDLIVADEPTTALDVTVQAQIIHILAALVREKGLALILITHDMGVVAQVCTSVAVLYAGRLAEARPVFEIFATPAHPYTTALIDCIPRTTLEPGSLTGIPGAVPSVASYPAGCRFHPRCVRAIERCKAEVPQPRPFDRGMVACHIAGGADV